MTNRLCGGFCSNWDGREMELEPGYVRGWVFNNFMVGGGLESIMEGIGDICNYYGEVVGGSDGDNQTECDYC